MKKFGIIALLVACLIPFVSPSLRSLKVLRQRMAESESASQLQSRNEARVAELSDAQFKAVDESRSSERFPNIQLVDHRGRKVHFYDDLVRDRCVCVNFFYTQCDGSCPGTTTIIKKLRRDLAAQFEADKLVFVSISLEPENDQPDALKRYAKAYGITDDDDLPVWYFATGDKQELEQLRKSLGLFELDTIRDADKSEHAATLTFGNDRLNRWSALPVGMNYDQLKTAMCRMMGNSARQRYSAVSEFRSVPAGMAGSREMK
jgi:cytochrome oxidase Cu insertion factor (SCO1/SenC/PrrC family)